MHAAVNDVSSARQQVADVSVIIPSHNRPALLQEALSSVLDQTIPPTEIIVVDDASDPPVRLPGNHSGITIRLLRIDQCKGGAAAKSLGAAAAQGDLIAFLDDDDLWAPTYLEHATTLLTRHADIDVLFMGVDWFGKNIQASRPAYLQAMSKVLADAAGKPLGPDVISFGPQLVQALLHRVPMAFQRPVVRRTAFQRIGGYMEHCLLWDCDWALRAALDGKVALCEAPLYRQRVDNQGYSSQPTREMEQTRSNIEIRERLANELDSDDASSRNLRQDFMRSASRNWFTLAYQLQLNGNTWAAFKAWINSQKIESQPGSLKLLLRILLMKRDRHGYQNQKG
jgi:glycosyltransferase involved in cell wall biosynthesis